jgi:hypothetical protein
MDQEGEEIATASYNLAKVIYTLKGDLIKAEVLARESLRISTHLQSVTGGYHGVGISCLLLARILESQGNFGDETKVFFERFLAFSVRSAGLDGKDTGIYI